MEEKPKKELTDKKVAALKKARVALVKSRDEKRLTMHENALDDVIERKLSKRLEELNKNLPIKSSSPPPPPPPPPQAPQVIYKKQPKQIIVYEDTEEEPETEEEEIIVKKKKPVKKILEVIKKPVKKAPIKKKQEPEYEEEPEPEHQYNRRQLNDDLYRNIFGR
jgi:hypothetical protein